jgi:twitching motility protein PilI
MAKHAPPAKKRATSFDTLVDYEARSLTHVPGRPESIEAAGHWRGVGFRLGQRRFVSSFEEVVEILSLPPVTPVPGAQSWMLGVANVRGSLLPVVDLKQFLEGERTIVHDGQRVLVVRQAGGNVAVIIDELFGQRTFNDTHRAELDGENEGRYGQLVNQVYRLADTSWGVFSMQTLTRTPEFRQATL